jgi:hypothetical protein
MSVSPIKSSHFDNVRAGHATDMAQAAKIHLAAAYRLAVHDELDEGIDKCANLKFVDRSCTPWVNATATESEAMSASC